MKIEITILLGTIIISCSIASKILDPSLDTSWNDFKKLFRKEYKSENDETERRLIWEENLRVINKHNLEWSLGKHTFTLKMNQFGDLTKDEFIRRLNGFNRTRANSNHISSNGKPFVRPLNVEIPDSVDWRKEGYVTPVKDQGYCGSCWAFSAIGSLEGQQFKKTGKLISLSEQNLIDCSGDFGNDGCEGGLMTYAFEYIKENNGVDTESSYAYTGEDGDCLFDPNNVGTPINGYVNITANISIGDLEIQLTIAISIVGPISVAIDVDSIEFMFYESGIYTSPTCSSEELNHGVVVVGYGSLGEDQDYYIVKNSWGTTWGDEGYVLIARNANNMCGIATIASYPTV